MVALIEKQIERLVNGRESGRELGCLGHVEKPLGFREDFFCSCDPLFDGSVGAHESARDFIHAEAAQYVENERDLSLLGQPRVAAREHHAQQVRL